MELKDRVVVITGSGGGIGEACARRFSDEGAHVVVTDVDTAGVERVTRELGVPGLAGDITRPEVVHEVAELARASHGEIDIWFSNAGRAGPQTPGELPADEWWASGWDLHVMAHVHAVREVLPAMLARGDGYLLQTASIVGLTHQPDKAAYSVTKHAALALAEWLAATYRPRGIKVSCFCPGPMDTPMFRANTLPADHPALSRIASPAEVAARLVDAIGAERFLVVDSDRGLQALAARAADYEAWINTIGG